LLYFEDDTTRSAGKNKKRKLRKPRLNKPPRIYGGVNISPKIDWVDVGLTVLSMLPLGRLVTLGGKIIGKAVKAAKVYKTAKTYANKTTSYTGKTLKIILN